jgi:DNA (cytosine-5)-methyltransferase 1
MGKPSGTRCIHPFQDRGLTAREGARLQGFPDKFHFSGGITSQRLQIANAVPPILAGIMGRTLAMESHWTSRVLPNFMKNCPANQLPINYNTY